MLRGGRGEGLLKFYTRRLRPDPLPQYIPVLKEKVDLLLY